MADTELPFHVIISTADGRVFESDLWARTAVIAVCRLAVDVAPESLITNVHARLDR